MDPYPEEIGCKPLPTRRRTMRKILVAALVLTLCSLCPPATVSASPCTDLCYSEYNSCKLDCRFNPYTGCLQDCNNELNACLAAC
jgi:hypothetical protein